MRRCVGELMQGTREQVEGVAKEIGGGKVILPARFPLPSEAGRQPLRLGRCPLLTSFGCLTNWQRHQLVRLSSYGDGEHDLEAVLNGFSEVKEMNKLLFIALA